MRMRKRPSWGVYEKNWVRFVLSYRLGEPGRTSRKIAYKQALYAMGHTSCKPFRKE